MCLTKSEPNIMTKSKLNILAIIAIVFAMGATSCTSMSFFTTDIRKRVEADSVPLNKLQFYVDRDVELRREVSSADVKVSSGEIKLVNGKYIHIIMLKKGTPGVCSKIHQNSLEISFEMGDGKTLTFGVTGVTTPNEVYRIFASEWIAEENGKIGRIKYENETYYIQPGGEGARLMVKKSAIDNSKVETKTMKGVKVQ